MIYHLTEKHIGAWVEYRSKAGEVERGRIKSFYNKAKRAFVVFHCAGEWDKYQEYTGQATRYDDLSFIDGSKLP